MAERMLTSVDGLALEAAIQPAEGPALGTVLAVHGITVDMAEGGGMFLHLAGRLAAAGFTVVRFSFRGHGGSAGTQEGATIAGELLDLQAAWEYTVEHCQGPVSIVAASFGAVSASLSLPYVGEDVHRLVLWNPVLDLVRTFVEPELPWGKENYGPEQQRHLRSEGYLLVDGDFRLGRVMFDEFRRYRPDEQFVASRMPALVVHGDQDSAVSYDIARAAADQRGFCDFHTVAGSDHGFDSREREDEAISVTVDWLVRQHTSQASRA